MATLTDNNTKKTPPKDEKATSGIYVEGPLFNEVRLDTQYGAQVKKYSLISRNPVVKSALDLIQSGVFWPDAGLNPNPANDYNENPTFEDLDNEIIDFVNDQLNALGVDKTKPPNANINPDFISALKTMSNDGRVYGYTVSEMVWDSRDGVHRLEKIKPKPSWNFDFEVDESDELANVIHNGKSMAKLEPDRFVLGIWPELKWGNYYGVSDLQCIEHDVKAIELLEEALVKGGQSSAYRPLVDHMNTRLSKEERAAGKSAIDNLTSGSVAHLAMVSDSNGVPHKAFELEVLEDRASEWALENLWSIINEYIKRINRALGIPDDLGNVTTAIGSFARAKTQFDMFVATVEKAQAWIETIANKIICTIIFYNFQTLPDGYELPIWSFQAVEEEFDLTKADFYDKLIKARILNAKEEFIRETFKFPPAPIEDEPEGDFAGAEEQEETGEDTEMADIVNEIDNLDVLNDNKSILNRIYIYVKKKLKRGNK